MKVKRSEYVFSRICYELSKIKEFNIPEEDLTGKRGIIVKDKSKKEQKCLKKIVFPAEMTDIDSITVNGYGNIYTDGINLNYKSVPDNNFIHINFYKKGKNSFFYVNEINIKGNIKNNSSKRKEPLLIEIENVKTGMLNIELKNTEVILKFINCKIKNLNINVKSFNGLSYRGNVDIGSLKIKTKKKKVYKFSFSGDGKNRLEVPDLKLNTSVFECSNVKMNAKLTLINSSVVSIMNSVFNELNTINLKIINFQLVKSRFDKIIINNILGKIHIFDFSLIETGNVFIENFLKTDKESEIYLSALKSKNRADIVFKVENLLQPEGVFFNNIENIKTYFIIDTGKNVLKSKKIFNQLRSFLSSTSNLKLAGNKNVIINKTLLTNMFKCNFDKIDFSEPNLFLRSLLNNIRKEEMKEKGKKLIFYFDSLYFE